MSCDRRCMDADDKHYGFNDCATCPDHDCGGCDVCRPSTDNDEEAIVAGWARVAKDYKPRPLTTLERHQVERAALAEKQAQETPFTLGEPLPGHRRAGG